MKEREFIGLSPVQMWKMKLLLERALNKSFGNKCNYCGEVIKKGTKFSIFNKPDRLVCNSIVCLSQSLEDDE